MSVRILVVDDIVDLVRTYCLLLLKHGYEAHTCFEAKDCLAMIETLRPDVVLLDLAMPMMNGYDIAEELGRHPDIRPQLLIAMSGLGSAEDREKTRLAGFDHHLLKPTILADLVSILATVQPRKKTG